MSMHNRSTRIEDYYSSDDGEEEDPSSSYYTARTSFHSSNSRRQMNNDDTSSIERSMSDMYLGGAHPSSRYSLNDPPRRYPPLPPPIRARRHSNSSSNYGNKSRRAHQFSMDYYYRPHYRDNGTEDENDDDEEDEEERYSSPHYAGHQPPPPPPPHYLMQPAPPPPPPPLPWLPPPNMMMDDMPTSPIYGPTFAPPVSYSMMRRPMYPLPDDNYDEDDYYSEEEEELRQRQQRYYNNNNRHYRASPPMMGRRKSSSRIPRKAHAIRIPNHRHSLPNSPQLMAEPDNYFSNSPAPFYADPALRRRPSSSSNGPTPILPFMPLPNHEMPMQASVQSAPVTPTMANSRISPPNPAQQPPPMMPTAAAGAQPPLPWFNPDDLFPPPHPAMMSMMGLPPLMPPIAPPTWPQSQQQQGGDFLPFLNDPNHLIAQAAMGMPPPQPPQAPPEESYTEPSQPDTTTATISPPLPHQAPMLRRGLSMLGGLFGGAASGQEVPTTGSKQDSRLAAEYLKLGTFWCWRQIDQTDQPFESFSIPNQKLMKRKRTKAKSQFMLSAREKKLPGDVLVDLEQRRGCCMVQRNGERFFVQLELKEETYDPQGGHFVFAGNGTQ
ncbi:MAG: hypothetical protein EXX96DRAFT_249470 [Benjaminiella poitrasii]|nr:MAG: hypothetical protein EXX96DRAFT_249470 [Benjaminiella poitrasii]